MSLLTPPKKPTTPYERLGGREPVEQLVARFYALMDSDPAFAELRAMHRGELTDMREKLSDFLVAWMGGPRDWFDKNPGACIMSAHGAMTGMGRQTAEQWVTCMTKAAEAMAEHDAELARSMLDAMASMCRTMARRAEEKAASPTAPIME